MTPPEPSAIMPRVDTPDAAGEPQHLAAPQAGFPCPRCGRTWTGLSRCHCATCHHSFTSATAFDRHRRAFRCRPPAEAGLVLRGEYWGLPGERPDDVAAGDLVGHQLHLDGLDPAHR